jgi:hypothetical protein
MEKMHCTACIRIKEDGKNSLPTFENFVHSLRKISNIVGPFKRYKPIKGEEESSAEMYDFMYGRLRNTNFKG